MINFTMRQLQIFDSVARHLSYTRAAEALHLTQPAVSMQIRQLEASAGLPLFEQLGKKIHLTSAGRELLQYCRNILQQMGEAENVLGELRDADRGRLAICAATTGSYLATQLLAEFCKRHPRVTVSLGVSNRAEVLEQLARNETDMAIMGRPPDGLDLEMHVFMGNPMVALAPPQHPLAAERGIPLQRLQQEIFLVREPGSGTRMAMERFFAERGIHLATGSEMSTNEAIKQAVQAGMGLGILSLHTVALELEAGRLVVLDVQSFPIMRDWYVVQRKGKRLTATAQMFKDFMLREGAQVAARKGFSSGTTGKGG